MCMFSKLCTLSCISSGVCDPRTGERWSSPVPVHTTVGNVDVHVIPGVVDNNNSSRREIRVSRSLVMPSVSDRLRDADLQQLSRTIRNEELFDQMSNIAPTGTRMGFVLRAKERARTNRVNNLFPWRIVRTINTGH